MFSEAFVCPRGRDLCPGGLCHGDPTPLYGEKAGGTHPTGMHSCFPIFL